MFFAHVTTGPTGLQETIRACQSIYEEDEFVVVRPDWREKGEINEAFERDWQFLNQPGISEYRYPFITKDSDRPAGVNDTSILVMKDKIMLVGRSIFPQSKRKFIPETAQEFSY